MIEKFGKKLLSSYSVYFADISAYYLVLYTARNKKYFWHSGSTLKINCINVLYNMNSYIEFEGVRILNHLEEGYQISENNITVVDIWDPEYDPEIHLPIRSLVLRLTTYNTLYLTKKGKKFTLTIDKLKPSSVPFDWVEDSKKIIHNEEKIPAGLWSPIQKEFSIYWHIDHHSAKKYHFMMSISPIAMSYCYSHWNENIKFILDNVQSNVHKSIYSYKKYYFNQNIAISDDNIIRLADKIVSIFAYFPKMRFVPIKNKEDNYVTNTKILYGMLTSEATDYVSSGIYSSHGFLVGFLAGGGTIALMFHAFPEFEKIYKELPDNLDIIKNYSNNIAYICICERDV